MTLLALDLKPDLPGGASSAQLADALSDHAGQYLAFLIAFALIAQYWSVHHRLMKTVRRTSSALLRATMLFLLGITLIPLTAYITGAYGNRLATTLFAANIVLVGLALDLIAEVIHHQRLDDVVEPDEVRTRRRLRSVVVLFIPVVVVALSFLLGGAAAWFYFLFYAADLPGALVTRRASSS